MANPCPLVKRQGIMVAFHVFKLPRYHSSTMCALGKRAFRGMVARHSVVHVGVSLFSFRRGGIQGLLRG